MVTQAQNLVTQVYNQTGSTLTKGTIVYVNGGHGNLPTVTKAIATSDLTSAQTYGVVRTDITNNNNGYVTVIGNLDNIDTQAYSAGTQLYLSGTTAGAWTSVKPYAPIHLVYVGIVVRSHPTQGVVEIRIQNGYEMDELHNVSAQNPNNGDILQYVSSTSLWTKTAGTTTNIAEGTNLYYTQARFDSAFGAKTTSNLTEGTNLYYTDARARGAISLTTTGNNGASTYNSTTGALNIPTYTLAGLGGINLTSLSATSPLLYNNTTGVFSIQQSSGSQAGFLSAADWTTFNNKQAALGYTPVPETRTLTINGVGYDLSADRSWTVTPNVNATNTQDYTATATQTTFTVTGGYTVGQLAVFYNGSKLASNEFTAIDGTTFTLATACQANDIVQAVVAVTGGGIGGSGTTNYLSKWTASGVLGNSLIQDNGTNITLGGALSGTNATFSDTVAITLTASDSRIIGGDTTGRLLLGNSGTSTYGIIYGATHATFPNAIQFVNNNAASLTLSSNGLIAFNGTGNGIPLRFQDISAAITGQTAGYIGLSTSAFSGKNGDLVLYPRTSDTCRILLMGGNVGIGTSSPSSIVKLDILLDATAVNGLQIRTSDAGTVDGSTTANVFRTVNSSAGNWANARYNAWDHIFTTSGSTERMRITSDGNVIVAGTTAANVVSGRGNLTIGGTTTSILNFVYGTTNSAYIYASGSGADLNIINTQTGGRLYCINNSGGVFLSQGATSWTANSDERLKDITGNIENAVDSLMTLRAVKHTWKADEDKVEKLALIAQEVEKVFPQVVDKGKLPSKADEEQTDNTEYLGVRYTELIPVLVKAIQEQQAMIEAQQQQINQLINK